MASIQIIDSANIVKEFKSNQINIKQSLVMNTFNARFEFEDIDWAF